jgi:chaperonin GroEL
MASKPDKWQRSRVVFQPDVHRGMLRGIEQMTDAVRPTLGPLPRIVLYDTTIGAIGKIPELLDDGGTIARRIIQIRGRNADVGAMLLRNVLWTVREAVGDGTATAAVVFEATYRSGVRYLAAGGNAMRLRTHLERGLREILNELDGMTGQVAGKEELTRLATVITREPELGKLLGEIFDIIGEYGRLEIRKGQGRYFDREYVEGMYWDGGLLSRTLITDIDRQRTELQDAAILMTDLEIEDPRDLIPVFSVCVKAGITDLAIICRRMSDIAIGMLVMNRDKGKIKLNAIGIKTPGISVTAQRVALTDMVVLNGGRPLLQASGDSMRNVKLSDLGRARRLWADKSNLGIIGGKGDPKALRRHIAHLRDVYVSASDADDRGELQERIGKLMGGSATLYVGGITKTEQDYAKEQAIRASDAMRGAMREGVLPGGGAALLSCRSMLRMRMAESVEPEERAAYHILLQAVEAPARTLLENTGYEPGEILGHLADVDPGVGFDVVAGQVTNMAAAGILDITTVVKTAVRAAISSAAMALTTDVVIHRATAPEALNT